MKKILIVDDEARMREVYTKLLEAEGFQVMEASNSIDANEILKKEEIGLVLLDLRMPEINGNILYEVLQLFHRNTKVLVSSVYHPEKQKKIISGAAGYHDKTQGTDILLAKIKKLFEEETSMVAGGVL